jgi:ribonuclease J
MVSITCFGGVNEIGGNKILVEDRKTRVFLDFGQSFSLLDDYFADWLQPRGRFGLKDYFALGLMPKTKGLYNKEALGQTKLVYTEPEFDAIILSHPHFDHTAHLQYIDPKIPIYMGEACKKILDSVQATTNSFFFREMEETDRDGTVHDANTVETFKTGSKLKIGSMEITPIHVDHSVPGAYGFIVETSEGTIAYSGDLRKHGNKPQMTEDFVQKAVKSDPKVLIIEGTRVSSSEKRKNHTEPFVYSESLKICQNTDKLILEMRYPKDLDRFRSFYKIAKETGKTLVITLKTAHLLLTLKDDEALNLPDPVADSSIEIYAREMKRYSAWEKPLLDDCVDSDWVKSNQKSVIWELDFPQLQELIDVEPEPGGACIHSMSEPFEEDPSSQLQDEVMHNWLDRFSMEHHQLHASGHAAKDEIFSIIDEVGAKSLIPVHTQATELFPKHLDVKKGKMIKL